MRGRNQSRSQRAAAATASDGRAQRSGERRDRCKWSRQSRRRRPQHGPTGDGLRGCGHILVSKRVADDLGEYEHWRPLLHDLGQYEVKHGVRVSVVNLYADQVGNAKLPRKLETVQKRRTRLRWAGMAAVLLALAAIVASI